MWSRLPGRVLEATGPYGSNFGRICAPTLLHSPSSPGTWDDERGDRLAAVPNNAGPSRRIYASNAFPARSSSRWSDKLMPADIQCVSEPQSLAVRHTSHPNQSTFSRTSIDTWPHEQSQHPTLSSSLSSTGFSVPFAALSSLFTPQAHLGRGGFGHVFRATSKVDGKDYAVKCIPLFTPLSLLIQSSELSSALVTQIREVECLSAVSNHHPNIVGLEFAWVESFEQAFKWMEQCSSFGAATRDGEEEESDSDDSSEEDKQSDEHGDAKPIPPITKASKPIPQALLFIQMELCSGPTLKQFLDFGKPINTSNGITVASQLVDALHLVHQQGWAHGDVTPANIFLSCSPSDVDAITRAKLGDFGLAHPLPYSLDNSTTPKAAFRLSSTTSTIEEQDSFSSSATAIGTPLYSSPETSVGCRPTDKSDIFSLGCVLVEMLSGFSTHMERVHVLQGLKRGEFPLLQCDSRLSDMLRAMTAVDPVDRPTTEQIALSEVFSEC
jgi:serine/threonine protein kinase